VIDSRSAGRFGFRVDDEEGSRSLITCFTQSFLSLLCGIAVGVGLIDDVHNSVYADTRLEFLASRHNQQITWHHLLQQTSEWDGELFGKRPAGHRGDRIGEAVRTPGTDWEYNDVRVNLLARCLLEVFREPLPDVLHEFVMHKLGASSSWSWHGYRTSSVTIGNRLVESVSGGAHWGGGIWMSSNDLALVGQVYLEGGRWNDESIVPDGWISRTTAACNLNPMYGYLWWLQHDQSGKRVSLAAQGGGSHHCFVIPDHELVVVARWIGNDAWPQFLDKALAVVTDAPSLGPVVYDWSQVNTVRRGASGC
jgi:CubicO group peptidase (beta-lactamase class C family)